MAPAKPAKIEIHPVYARPLRGPKDGRWYWQAVRYVGDEQRTVWTGWGTREEASKTIAGLVSGGDLDAPPAAPEPGGLRTVRDLMETWIASVEANEQMTYSGRAHYRNRAKPIAKGIGTVLLDRLRKDTIEGYVNERLREGNAPSTVRQEVKAIGHAWRWAREHGHGPDRDLVAPRVKLPRVVKPTPDGATTTSILDHLPAGRWPRVAVLLLAATGARIGEIADLEWQHLDLPRGTVLVNGKTGPREIPLAPDVVTALRFWKRDDDGPADGVLRVSPKVVRAHLSCRYLRDACEAAKVGPFTPRALRRAAVDAFLRSGVDVGTAGAIMGHTPEVMLAYYRQATPEDKRAAIVAAGLGTRATA